MEFKHFILQAILLLEILLLKPISCFDNCDFPAIFNFGDSNSDTGGLSAAFGQAPPPNGETFFHAPAGRFCDGRLLIDLIAERLGLPHLCAFLDSIGSNFSHGANFATAGSTIRPQNTTISKRSFHNLLPEEGYFSRALYTFDIGQNDLTAGYKLNWSTEQVKAYVPDVLNQFSRVIKLLYAQGGKSFWIHNTGPVGCLPYVMDRFSVTAAQIDKYGCSSPYNQVAQYFNLRLKETVLELRKQLPQAAITYVDVYSVKYSLISQAKKLGKILFSSLNLFLLRNHVTFRVTLAHFCNQMTGFENPILVCCGHGGKYNYNRFVKCGSKRVVNGKEIVLAKSCKDPSVRTSWDGTHFTEAANRWIFDQIVDGSFSDPPVSLKFACNRISS
ncbi:UNVERIFIED_CONTAM: GDSL esterase/lipase [Sesamum radiatum]|uniref:GDSL esterase/lipase n=1 Tax=Sesamum radiatum TaxID=300843 RepID=A0AAW2JSF3_SESRA